MPRSPRSILPITNRAAIAHVDVAVIGPVIVAVHLNVNATVEVIATLDDLSDGPCTARQG